MLVLARKTDSGRKVHLIGRDLMPLCGDSLLPDKFEVRLARFARGSVCSYCRKALDQKPTIDEPIVRGLGNAIAG